MGLLKTIGTIAGTAIGAYVGNPGLGAKIGGTIGGAVEGGKKKTSSGATAQPVQPPKMDLADLRSYGTSSAMGIMARGNDTKVARTANVPAFGPTSAIKQDPWVDMNNWWVDLGGDPGRLKKIDDTRLP
jgi:hypothetical protein